ncbi:MAG: relaxase domain-containing protein [Actinobacteria bacterium]|nr:relaxase domain-containing protein [Actinomycetota bacterium]
MPDELLGLWSKRTAKIDAEAGPKIAEYEKLLGRALSPGERVGVVKTAVLKTRSRKKHPEVSVLHAIWTAEAAWAGWTPDRLRRAVGLRTPPDRDRLEQQVLPTWPAGPSGLAELNPRQVADTDRHRPHGPGVLLPAPERVLPADSDGSPTRDRVLPVGDEVLPAGDEVCAGVPGSVARPRIPVAGSTFAHLRRVSRTKITKWRG